MENHLNRRCLGILIKTLSKVLLRSRRRVLLLAVFDAALIVILVFCWNSRRREPQIKGVLWKISRASKLKQIWNETKPVCKLPRLGGSIVVDYTRYDMSTLEKKYPELLGGQYLPPECVVQHRVAIIVPLRGQLYQLSIFLNHMHAFLMKQNIEYGIFMVEQTGEHAFKYFNRGMLLNVGFLESHKYNDWECFIFHDIHLLPLDPRNIYSCPHAESPRHHAAVIHKNGFSIPHETHFGGVLAFTEEQFTDVNGYSNQYWGTGGEDDDLFSRLNQENYSVARYLRAISRYASLRNKQELQDAKRNAPLDLFAKDEAKTNYQEDGLSVLKYRATTKKFPLFTHIKVDLKVPSSLRIDLTLDQIFRGNIS